MLFDISLWLCAALRGPGAREKVAGHHQWAVSSRKPTAAPWEARTPDLEVNSLTLWPAELRKLLSVARGFELGLGCTDPKHHAWLHLEQVPAAEARSPGRLEVPPLRLTASRSGQLS